MEACLSNVTICVSSREDTEARLLDAFAGRIRARLSASDRRASVEGDHSETVGSVARDGRRWSLFDPPNYPGG